MQGQVTIGSAIETNTGSILDLKQEDNSDGSANSTKGFGLPRVALTDINRLEPCVATNDTTMKSHIGLTVFNITDNASTLTKGVYTWDGKEWVGNWGFSMSVDNGLTLSDNKIELGGTLSKSTTIYQVDQPLIFNSANTAESSATFGTSNAVLDLSSDKKGFMPPRIALTSGTDSETIHLTIEDQGMVVYNIGSRWSNLYYFQLHVTYFHPTRVSYKYFGFDSFRLLSMTEHTTIVIIL